MKILIKLLFCLALASTQVSAHEDHTGHQKSELAISVAVDSAGAFWRASVHDGFVVVDKSSDLGKTFSAPVKVNVTPQKIGAEGEARPKIAIGPEGNIYLTWTEGLKAPFAGYVWFARSIDSGKSFEPPYIVHQDRAEITHRFDALNVAPNGSITVTWIDKRDLIAAKAAKRPYDGAAIYYAVSTDKGVSFKPEQKLADSTCECCRIVTANKPDGTVVALWRHVFQGSERDHMIAEIPQKSDQTPIVKRATFGHWKIDGCPHHGAAIASGSSRDWQGYHMAYFDGNDNAPGLYYSRMDDVTWTASSPQKFGDNAKQAGHPALLNIGESLWLAWREIKAGRASILSMYSGDGGKSWSAARTLKSTSQKTDYPILIQHKNQPYLVWNTQQNGIQIILLQK